MIDRDALIRAALAGFAMSKEGFNGECAYDHLIPDEREFRESFAIDDPVVTAAMVEALRRAGILPAEDPEALERAIAAADDTR